VRTLLVVLRELIEAALLCSSVGGHRIHGLLLQCQMHAFVAVILLRVRRLMRSGTMPSFIHHSASRDNPAMARKQRARRCRCAFASGRPTPEMRPRNACTRPCPSSRPPGSAADSAAGIADGQRIDALAILASAPALKSPHHTRWVRWPRRTVSYTDPSGAASYAQSQPLAAQKFADVLTAGHLISGRSVPETTFSLRVPTHMCLPQCHDLLLGLARRLMGMTMRRTLRISKPFQPSR